MRIGPTRHSKNGARMDTNEGRRQDGASLFPFLLFSATLVFPSSASGS